MACDADTPANAARHKASLGRPGDDGERPSVSRLITKTSEAHLDNANLSSHRNDSENNIETPAWRSLVTSFILPVLSAAMAYALMDLLRGRPDNALTRGFLYYGIGSLIGHTKYILLGSWMGVEEARRERLLAWDTSKFNATRNVTQKEISHYKKHGFVLLKNILPDAYVDFLETYKDAMENSTLARAARAADVVPNVYHSTMLYDRELAKQVFSGPGPRIAAEMMGSDQVIWAFDQITDRKFGPDASKDPEISAWEWHLDGMALAALPATHGITTFHAITPLSDDKNGCTHFVSATHYEDLRLDERWFVEDPDRKNKFKVPRTPELLAELDRLAVPVCTGTHDILLFSLGTIHRTNDRLQDKRITFNPRIMHKEVRMEHGHIQPATKIAACIITPRTLKNGQTWNDRLVNPVIYDSKRDWKDNLAPFTAGDYYYKLAKCFAERTYTAVADKLGLAPIEHPKTLGPRLYTYGPEKKSAATEAGGRPT